MRNFIWSLLAGSLLLMMSCAQEDIAPQQAESRNIATTISNGELVEVPDAALQFLALTYPNVPVVSIDAAPSTDLFAFQIILENGIEAYFDLLGEVLWMEEVAIPGIDAEARFIAPEMLPTLALTYLQETYPGIQVRSVLKNQDLVIRNSYEVELVNGTVIRFDSTGKFLSKESV